MPALNLKSEVQNRLDPTGLATYDTWTGNSIQYAFGGHWLRLGSFIDSAGDPLVPAADNWTTAGGYKNSRNSQPECAPLPVTAFNPVENLTVYPSSWIGKSFTDLSTFTQQVCLFCEQYIFQALKLSTLPIDNTEAGFHNFLNQGHQYCDGTQSGEKAEILKNSITNDDYDKYKSGSVKDYFKVKNPNLSNPGLTAVALSRTLLPKINIFTFILPSAISDSQISDVALLYHEGLHSFGDWSDTQLCNLVDQPQPEPAGINSNACIANHSVFNYWLENHPIIPNYPLFTGP